MSNKMFLCTIAFISILSSILFASDLGYNPDELIVRFSPKEIGEQRTIAERNEILAEIGGGTVKDYSIFVPGLTLVKLPKDMSVENSIRIFKNTNGILSAQPNYIKKAVSMFPDDTMFGQLWGMHNVGQTDGIPDADIDAPEAWDINTNAGDVIVAVIDSGVDYTHPDLLANMWTNPVEELGDKNGDGRPGVRDFDDDGDGLIDEDSEHRQPWEPGYNNDLVNDDDENGFNDDIYGYDFCEKWGKPRDSDPMDDNGHGTHCAGIIGAVGNNILGVTGVCWNVRIMAIKFLDSLGSGNTWDEIQSIRYAINMGAKVLSISSGGPGDDQEEKAAIEEANANGIIFVAAAGNSGSNNDGWSPFYPASYDCENIIAVMATDKNDERWILNLEISSNWGTTSVDLSAPGSDILSCVPYYIFGKYYEYSSGTSMSTPHVAGACALIWSSNPTLSHLQVKQVILDTVDTLEGLDGLCVTEGRLNLYNAVIEAAKNEQMLSKVDIDGDSVLPYEEITYRITYANPVTNPDELTGVTITDYLPDEVDYSSSPGGIYNSDTRTVTWNIPSLPPGGDPGTVTLTVTVNLLAEPLGTITNRCDLRSNEYHTVIATEITNVDSWEPDVIYVDMSAPGSYTGMSWEDAYSDLQDALERADAGCGSEIWVAAGTYRPSKRTDPGNPYTATFQLVNGVPIYGGFAGGETSRSQRNWLTNQTILTGDIDSDGDADIQCVVTASNVTQATIIDGFVITKGSVGMYCCDGSSATIMNNTIQQNSSYGIDIKLNSSPDIKDCLIQDNTNRGIDCRGSALTVSNCTIQNNNGDGIYDNGNLPTTITNSKICGNSVNGIHCVGKEETLKIKNNWIYDNGEYTNADGILISSSYAESQIRNNTIVYNAGYGINSLWSENVNISNCILWGNNNNGDQLCNCSASYSWVQNINTPPLFFDEDADDYHLTWESGCVDTGDPGGNYDGENDIDGNPRVAGGRVDIGGDEDYPHCDQQDYNEWTKEEIGRPNCWFTYFQCKGDADNAVQGLPKYRVYTNDFNIMVANWKKTLNDDINLSADFNHKPQGLPKYRVYTDDYNILIANWKKTDDELQPHCLDCQRYQQSQGKTLTSQELVKWLEQIWLDEEAQKLIDKDVLLKFIESLKKEL